MVPLYIVLIVFSYLKTSETTFVLGDIFDETINVQKREVPKNQKVDFILEKLIQHTQALEHLVKIIEDSEEILKRIADFISTKIEQPLMPEKIENSRRSLGRNMEEADDLSTTQPMDDSKPWCQVALLCVKSGNSVCGFDESFGYAKFVDICHMFQVNCVFKYHFVLSVRCGLVDYSF